MSKVTVVVSTNKTTYWQRFCDAIAQNNLPVDIIMVGPLGNQGIKLPVSVRHIKSNARPAMCWAIGCREATNEFVCPAADDCIFTPHFFDAAVAAMPHLGEFDMLTGRYFNNGCDQFGGMRIMSVHSMPLLPVGGVSRTASYRKLGGIDKRFHAVVWDTDLYQRHLEAGGTTTLMEGHSYHEVSDGHSMFVANHEADVSTLRSFWFTGKQPNLHRSRPVEPYTDEELLQGIENANA